MKVGDYVRFYDRDWTEIGKIVGEVEDSHLKVVKCKDGYYDLDNFIKSSPNIIDLIEVGDYVNGEKVGYIDDCEGAMREYYYESENPNEDCGHWFEEIETIVTKEQFESMSYKVGE